MTRISKSDFFEKIGPRNVTPRVDQSSLPQRYHVSLWETRTRIVMAKTVTDSWGVKPTEFWISAAA